MDSSTTAVLFLALTLAATTLAGAQQATFTAIPVDNPVTQSTTARSVNADGSIVAGVEDGQAFIWNAIDGKTHLTTPDWQATHWADVSADGRTLVSTVGDGSGSNSYPGRWDSESGWLDLGSLPGTPFTTTPGTCYAVSGDGSTVVGLGWDGGYAEAFKWTAATGMTGLGRPTDRSSRASSISDDGSVIVGWAEAPFGNRRPTRWVNDGPMDVFLGDNTGEAYGTSSDGRVIVGGYQFDAANSYGTPFRYTDEDGVVDLGRLQTGEFDGAFATAVSDTGVIVGLAGNEVTIDWRAMIWTPTGGMEYLQDYLTDRGVDLTNWYLLEARDISTDGTTIVGMAANLTTFGLHPFVATIPLGYSDGFESGSLSDWTSVVGVE